MLNTSANIGKATVALPLRAPDGCDRGYGMFRYTDSPSIMLLLYFQFHNIGKCNSPFLLLRPYMFMILNAYLWKRYNQAFTFASNSRMPLEIRPQFLMIFFLNICHFFPSRFSPDGHNHLHIWKAVSSINSVEQTHF
jgi:hypothetical protein